MSPGRGDLVTLAPRELRVAELAKLTHVNGRDGARSTQGFTKGKPADHETALSASQWSKVTWPNWHRLPVATGRRARMCARPWGVSRSAPKGFGSVSLVRFRHDGIMRTPSVPVVGEPHGGERRATCQL
jgi:hypothetical protein